MKNKKTKFDIVCDIVAYVFLVVSILLCLFLASCTAPKSVIEHNTLLKDSIYVKTDTLRVNKTTTSKETVFSGISEEFTLKADSLGNIPEYKRKFNTGAISGEIGYSKDVGNYYKLSSKDITEKDKETFIDTTSKTHSETKTNTLIDKVSDKILITKKWGRFQWVTFIISLLVFIYISYKMINYLTNPVGFLKIFKRK